MEMNRRSFLKGAAAAGAIASMGALASCSPSQSETDRPGNVAAEVGSSEGLTSQVLNQKWSFEIPPDPISDSDIADTVEDEIIVVGAGISGLVTALAAAENGASVTLICAGTKAVSRGGTFHAFKSDLLREVGLGNPYEGVIGDFFQREMFAQNYGMDQRKWYTIYNNSEQTMNWLVDKMKAANYECVIENFVEEPGIITQVVGGHSFMGDEITSPGAGGPLVTKVLQEEGEALGVKYVWETCAKQLIREDNNTGKVTAVVAQNAGGDYVKYAASKAIVLATGDFSADQEMMAKYAPEMLPWLTDNGVDYDAEFQFGGLMPGDGHKMGLWVGAAWQHSPKVASLTLGGGGPTAPPCPDKGLIMDQRGDRIGNEDMNLRFLIEQMQTVPDRAVYLIWSQNAARTFTWPATGPYGSGVMKPEEVIESWEQSASQNNNFVKKGDSIEEVAEMLGLQVDAVQDTVDRYNELCEAGNDTDFYKRSEYLAAIDDGPFYGAEYKGEEMLSVFGGLRTNEHMQVCDENDQPIEGLYNVGAMVGDFQNGIYTLLVPGFSLGGMCVTYAYLTGKALATI